MRVELWYRERRIVNTDPQRRCYDGHHFSSREEWSEWKLIGPYASEEDARSSAATFKSINPRNEYEVRP